jgi:hypothetical protein
VGDQRVSPCSKPPTATCCGALAYTRRHPPLLGLRRLPPGTDPRSLDYTVNPARDAPFYAAIRSYLPGLPDGALQPSYAGVRPKVGGWLSRLQSPCPLPLPQFEMLAATV